MTGTFRLINRLFWLVWILYPLVFLSSLQPEGFAPVGTPPEVCRPWLMDDASLTPRARAVLWARVGAEFVIWGIGLGLGHWVIHRAAKGRVLVTEILWPVRAMALLLLIWPVVGLILDNLTAWTIANALPGQDYAPIWLPDIGIMGFGLFTIRIATVLTHAVDLARETELTI